MRFTIQNLIQLSIVCGLIIIISCANDSDPDQNPVLEIALTVNKDSVPNGNTDTTIVNLDRTIEIYTNNCGGCHGQQMESFIKSDWLYGNSVSEINRSIKAGYENNGMPAYGNTLTEQEISDLSKYLIQETKGKTLESLYADNPDFSALISSDELDFKVETITDAIDGTPWGITQLPNGGDFLVTVLSGKIYRITKSGQLTAISGVPEVKVGGQGGLLDITLHPDFSNNDYIYISYSGKNPDNSAQSATTVARAKFQDNSLNDLEVIFTALPYVNSGRHFGSRVIFGNDGYLYISVGERGKRDVYPQDLATAHGKIHRLTDAGEVPDSNPFVDNASAVKSIFVFGNRNPQGLAIHPVTGALWEGEHGPKGGDEINIIEAGNNYGWPVISYGVNYNGTSFTDLTEKEGMEQPIHYWVPSIAPAGMDFIASNYYGHWKHDLFVSSLKFEYLHRLKMDGNEVVGEEELLKDIGRVRDVQMGSDGYLYIIVQDPGRLLRLVPVE